MKNNQDEKKIIFAWKKFNSAFVLVFASAAVDVDVDVDDGDVDVGDGKKKKIFGRCLK